MDELQLIANEGDSGQMMKRVVRICKKGRWLIALGALIAVLVATVGLTFIPRKYRSEATILVVDQQISPDLVQATPVGQRLEAMTREVLSQDRLLEIIDKFNLFGKTKGITPDIAVDMIRRSIDTQAIDARQDQFSAFSISFIADTPQLAQDVTRTLASLFIERSLENQANRAKLTTNFIQEQMAQKQKDLDGIERRLQDFKTQHYGELPDDRAVNQERRREAQTQLEASVASLNRAKGQRAVWESTLTGELNARLNVLKGERTALLKNFTAQHPQVLRKDDQIAQIEAELQWFKSGAPVVKGGLAPVDAGLTQLEGQLQANAIEVESLTNEVSRRTAAIAESESRLSATPTRELQLAELTRRAEELRTDMSELQKKQQQTALGVEMEKREEGQRFKLLDPPRLPVRPSSPQSLRISLAAVLAGGLAGLILAFLLDLRNTAFHNEDELRQRFAPPLLLSIPGLPTPKEQRARSWKTGFEVFAATVVTAAIAVIELYVYRHP